MTIAPNRPAVQRRTVPAAMCGAVAVALAILSLTVLRWFHAGGGLYDDNDTTFGTLHHGLSGAHDNADTDFGIAPAYFGWLAYVLVALAVVGALGCALPAPAAVRLVTATVSVAGFGLTLWAIDLFTLATHPRRYVDYAGDVPKTGYLDWLARSSFGAWAMLTAFALCAVAALIPRGSPS